MRKLAIAIDGPAGAGKSSVAKILAANMGYAYLDTGAMYRAVTYEVLRQELTEEKDIVALAAGMDMTVKPETDAMHVIVNGHDVTDHIRTPEVSARVSAVSALAGVRAAMVEIQRRQAAKGGIVLDGRDIGTTVLPHADVKIFLTASVHTRALRRFKEMTEKNPGMTLEEVEKDIRKRDWQDSHREVSPLKQAEDAVLLDNSRLTLEETAKAIMEICERNGKSGGQMFKKIFYSVVRVLFNGLFFGIYGLHVEGRENIPRKGAIIVAPNHKSNFDPPIVGVAFKDRIIHYMAKEELFKNPIFGYILRQFGTFPVKRGSIDRMAIRRAILELKEGNALGIFPEGTRIQREGLGRFHSGMASLAFMSGVSILPVAVVGSVTMPRKCGPLAVLIGKPIEVKKQRADDEAVEALNKKVKEEIQKLTDEYMEKINTK